MKRRLFPLIFLISALLAASASAQTLTLTFIGDTSIGDAFQSRSTDHSYHSVVKREGMAWPFSLVSETLKADDLTIANLEGSLTTRSRRKDNVRYPLIINPAHTEILLLGGVDVVNTANNHAYDYFQDGYSDTKATLDAAGIGHFGTLSPPSKTGEDRQLVLEVKGVKIGFLGYTYPQNSDVAHMGKVVAGLREQGCELVILSVHWGRETHMKPNNTQYSFAKKAVDAGVDLIFGHHPHVVQPIALYKGSPVLFSTGNFTFGTMSKVDPSTGMFQVEYDLTGGAPRLSALRVLPCTTSGAGDYRPKPVTDEAGRLDIFKKLTFKTAPKGFTALPDSFLTSGEAVFIPE